MLFRWGVPTLGRGGTYSMQGGTYPRWGEVPTLGKGVPSRPGKVGTPPPGKVRTPPSRPGKVGTPPPVEVWTDTQSENITSHHPSDAGGKYSEMK